MAGTNISFDGNSLQTANILTADIDHASIPTKAVSIFALSHANRSTIPFVNYPSKTVRVSGKIFDTSVAGLDSRIDTFRGYFIGQDKNLDIDYNGSTRRYTATVNSLSISRPGGLLYADFAIEFICSLPWGQNTSSTTAVTGSARTSSSYADAVTWGGTAPYQLPVITVTLTTVGGSPASGTVSVGNNGTGQQINVTRTWTSGDVLVIDCSQNTVTVNGVAVTSGFTGAFPSFPPGSGTIGYADSFASRTFNYSVVYNQYFL